MESDAEIHNTRDAIFTLPPKSDKYVQGSKVEQLVSC
jgi:hypothetical protein